MVPADAPAVSRVYQANFPAQIKRLSSYGQFGLSEYLSDLLQNSALFENFRFYIYELPEGIGFAEFRVLGVQGFLSNIFVDQALQGRGVGTQLIERFLDEHPFLTSLSLDVFESNLGALRLYERLGFKRETPRGWYICRLGKGQAETAELATDGLLSRIAMYQRYGFTEYQVADGPLIGRLGEQVLRCRAPEDAFNSKVLGAIERYFPEIEEAFCISPEPLPDPWSLVDTSWRMTLPLKGKVEQ